MNYSSSTHATLHSTLLMGCGLLFCCVAVAFASCERIGVDISQTTGDKELNA